VDVALVDEEVLVPAVLVDEAPLVLRDAQV
jgi:hypothetical protein